MQFEWLAALAYPRAIAVHPNFSNDNPETGPARLASEVLAESRNYPRRLSDEQFGEEYAFADLCIRALREADKDSLKVLQRAADDEEMDLGRRVCAGIIIASLRLESDLPSKDSLDALLRATSDRHDSSTRLANLWVQLASTVLATQYGEDKLAQIRNLRLSLENFGAELADVEFRTTRGLDLSARTVFLRILDLLSHAALQLEISIQGLEGDLWMQGLRRQTPVLLASLESKVATGYSGWTKRDYIELTRRGTKFFGGSSLPGDEQMAVAVRIAQFAFHPFARHAALELGRARFLRGYALESQELRVWLIESALTLMRFSQDRETTASAVRYALRYGPLVALNSDLRNVVTSVAARGTATHLEIDYLFEAATLLARKDARSLFETLSEEFIGAREAVNDRWTAPWSRRESLGKFLGRVTGPADAAGRFTEMLAGQLSHEATDDQDRVIALALQAMGPNISRTDSGPLLEVLRRVPGYPSVRAALPITLNEPEGDGDELVESNRSPMDQAAAYVDRLMGAKGPSKQEQAASHSGVIEDALREMEVAAGRGLHNLHGTAPLDVAVAFALFAPSQHLWPLITQVIENPLIARGQKDAALDRLARSVEFIPAHVRDDLGKRMPALLNLPGSPFDGDRTPYPAALRASAAFGSIRDTELMATLGPWLSSTDPSDRINAVSVLGAIRSGTVPPWAIQSLVSTTFDSDAEVKADAMQVLAYMYPRAGLMQNLILDRANDLLASDGTWLQRKVLAELGTDAGQQLRERLVGRVHALTRHIDWRVRVEAGIVASSIA